MIALLCACLALLPAAPADEIVATAGPVTFGSEAYADWLIETFGHVHLEDYVLEQVMVIEAEARGLRPTDDELEAAFKSERDGIIKDFFAGDVDRYVQDKYNRGVDVKRHEARRRVSLLSELCLVAMAQDDREITEEQLRKRYKVNFGDLGERIEVEVLFYSLYYGGEQGSDGQTDLVAADKQARSRAERAREALLAGAAVEDLLEASDPIQSAFVVDGRIAQWRKKLLGTESEQAVNSLDDPGQVSPPVKVWDGYYVLRLVDREEVSFEQARDELERQEREAYPTAEQLSETRASVKELYPTELFLR